MGTLRNYLTVWCAEKDLPKFTPVLSQETAFQNATSYTKLYKGIPITLWVFPHLRDKECKRIVQTVANVAHIAAAFWHQQYEGETGLPIFTNYEDTQKGYFDSTYSIVNGLTVCKTYPQLRVGGQNVGNLNAYIAVVLSKSAYFALKLLSLLPKEGDFQEEQGIWYAFGFDVLQTATKQWQLFINEGLLVLQSAFPGQFKILWRDLATPKMHVFGRFQELSVEVTMCTVHDTQEYISRIRECPHTTVVEVQRILATVT